MLYNGKIKNNLMLSLNLATINAKINQVKGEIRSITDLATTTTALNITINEVKNKISNVSNLATTTALNALKIKYLMLVKENQ